MTAGRAPRRESAGDLACDICDGRRDVHVVSYTSCEACMSWAHDPATSPRSFREALAAYRKAERCAETAMKGDFPIGSFVQWSHGEQTRRGWVVDHGAGLRIRVRTMAEALVWVRACLVHEVHPTSGLEAKP